MLFVPRCPLSRFQSPPLNSDNMNDLLFSKLKVSSRGINYTESRESSAKESEMPVACGGVEHKARYTVCPPQLLGRGI